MSNSVEGAQRPPTTQDRIQQLEGLVIDLMQRTSTTAPITSRTQIDALQGTPSPPSSVSLATSGPQDLAPTSPDQTKASSSASHRGSMQLSNAGTSYVDSAHWTAVLDGIAELKDHLEKGEETQESRPLPEQMGPQLLRGGISLVTREEIINSIPERLVVDRLISRYFNSFEMSPGELPGTSTNEDFRSQAHKEISCFA